MEINKQDYNVFIDFVQGELDKANKELEIHIKTLKADSFKYDEEFLAGCLEEIGCKFPNDEELKEANKLKKEITRKIEKLENLKACLSQKQLEKY